MKTIKIIIALSFLGFAAYAQFDSTKFVVDGQLSYSNSHYSNKSEVDESKNKSSSFYFSPSVAKAIKSDALIGLQLGLGLSSSKYESDQPDSESSSQYYSLGVFYQRYHRIVDKVYFNWRTTGGAGYTHNKYVFGPVNSTATSHSMTYLVSLTPGVSWRVMDRMFLNGSVGGASFSYIDTDSGGFTSFDVSFNRPRFGFSFLIY